MSFGTQLDPLHTSVILQTAKMFIGHLHWGRKDVAGRAYI